MIDCIFEDGGKGNLRHAVIDAIVLKKDKILLTKRVDKLLEGGKWGLIGGFVDRDETVEHAVKREVFEETGYRITNIKFLTIVDNPNRLNEKRQNIAFVFSCEAGDKEGEPDWESTEQKWFEFDKLPEKEEMAFDHFQTIRLYREHKNNKTPFPVFVSS